MAEDWTRVFYRGANVKVFRLRIVGWDEIEAAVVLVVNAGRIHEAAGTGWLKRLRQLTDLKPAQVSRQRYEIIGLQEVDHFGLTAFVGFQKRFLIFWHIRTARRIRISQR